MLQDMQGPVRAEPLDVDARRLTEEAREVHWKLPSFLKELFGGDLRLDLLHAPHDGDVQHPEFLAFKDRMRTVLATAVDSDAIDRDGKVPPELVQLLGELGAFGMKIGKEYGGLGLSQCEYGEILQLVGSQDSNLIALLSAHQSIGVPQPLQAFGTAEQKRKYLPMLAHGAVSAFALTEPMVGSDPAQLATTVQRQPDGSYRLSGEKLWCTNGTIASCFVVMARHEDTGKISAFVVEAGWPGVQVVHRCRFMGLRALENAVLRFRDVAVPRENLLGAEGEGLKIALVTLNTGRLSLPAAAAGIAKRCLQISRLWASSRVQWGQPIGQHEAIAQILADMAATSFAIDAVSRLCDGLADAHDRDIRLEAAVAKMWCTEEGWRLVDQTLQVRGGRGYETADSLRARGEPAVPVERMLRDYRINLIFEGSSEIMRLFIAREALDAHLHLAGVLVDPKAGFGRKVAALPRIAAHYLWWYPTRWLGWHGWPRYAEFGPLAKHMRFVAHQTSHLARALFHAMVRFGPKLEKKQATLFRAVDIGADLFAMTAVLLQAQALRARAAGEAQQAAELADLFCRTTRRRVQRRFAELAHNDDMQKRALAGRVLRGNYDFLERELADAPEVARLAAPLSNLTGKHA